MNPDDIKKWMIIELVPRYPKEAIRGGLATDWKEILAKYDYEIATLAIKDIKSDRVSLPPINMFSRKASELANKHNRTTKKRFNPNDYDSDTSRIWIQSESGAFFAKHSINGEDISDDSFIEKYIRIYGDKGWQIVQGSFREMSVERGKIWANRPKQVQTVNDTPSDSTPHMEPQAIPETVITHDTTDAEFYGLARELGVEQFDDLNLEE